MTKLDLISQAFGWFALLVVLYLLSVFPVMWLWNYVVPSTFNGVGELTYSKALCLMVLISGLRSKFSYGSHTKE